MSGHQVRKESPHGTPARYRMHLRDGEKACRDCTQAESRRVADYKTRNHEKVLAYRRKHWAANRDEMLRKQRDRRRMVA